jgi:chorismate mutase
LQKSEYFIIDQQALPEVYGQVVEAKRLLASGKAVTVQEAVEAVGISRSSFYKYKDMIEPFTDIVRKKTVTIAAKLDDRPGVLPRFLMVLENAGVNILTIHQAVPINGLADVSLSMEVLEAAWSIDQIIGALKEVSGVCEIQILARE